MLQSSNALTEAMPKNCTFERSFDKLTIQLMSITLIIVIMTCLVSYQATNKPSMHAQLMFRPASIKNNGEWYRFLTHGFVHSNQSWLHLIINMYVLWIFGESVERWFGDIFSLNMGKIVYILFYLGAIIIASIPNYFRHQDNYAYAAVGASGATSAIVMAFIIQQPWALLLLFFIIPVPAIIAGVLFLFYSSYMDKKGMDNIDHNAHFWGAIFGLVFVIISLATLRPDLLDLFIYKLLNFS